MPLQTGTKAPDFTLRSRQNDQMVDMKLSDNYGKQPTVLFFFPGTYTAPCTKEMCEITERLEGFEGATTWGISVDSAFAQAAWAKSEKIDVTLLSDYKHEVTRAYDVELPDLAGLGPSAARAVYVIDKDGVIRYAEQTPTPGELPNLDAVQKALDGLR